MEPNLKPGHPAYGRIVDLPGKEAPGRLWVMAGEHLLALEGEPALLQGLAPGDLVRFSLDDEGRIRELGRVAGPVSGAWDETGDGLRWRRPGEEVPRMALLGLRQAVLREVRAYFEAEGFLEVETPAVVPAPSPEPQFAPLAAGDRFLITSPEFQLKRLLVGGFERIFRIGPVFRGGERGRLHNPEFTLLEWYRAHRDLEAMAADLEALLGRLAPLAAGTPEDEVAGGVPGNAALAPALGRSPFVRLTVRELFHLHLGIDLKGVTTPEALREAARQAGHPAAPDLPHDFERAFFTLWTEIETRLGPEPLLVTEWPAPLGSLARLKPDDPTVAERMELYAGGLELANGFAELTDPAEQRRRFEADLAARRAQGLPPVPLDERFLAALAQGMPPAAGMALGFDRLVMLVAGVSDIRQVLAFADDES
jgi:lysyl-tRNA synthetase class 2